MIRCFVLLLHLSLGASASVFDGAADEAAAKKLADEVDLKSLSSADFTFLIKEKRWLSATHRVLAKVQETPLDFSAPVRSAVSSVRKELDDLIRALDKSYGEASQISPAFQWAQNSSHVFLQIKFAQRWNAPGALEVQNTSIKVSDCCFSFQGVGEHSMIKKEYKLFLQFLDPVSEEGSSWHLAAAGRLAVTVKKVRARKWERLLRSENVAPENMGVWQDMQAKWKTELASLQDGKLKKDKSKDSDDDDEDEDEEQEVSQCNAGSFSDSKVVEMCPKAFLSGKKPFIWSLLFYSPKSANKQSQGLTQVWRALADFVPGHNKNAAIAAVDCSQYGALCDQQGAKAASLPVVNKYAPGTTDGVAYTGEMALEDLASWAAGAQEEDSGKKGKKKKSKKGKKEL